MSEIKTKEFFVLDGRLYPVANRPPDCSLKAASEQSLQPQALTVDLLKSNDLCAEGCRKCEITIG